MSVLDHLLRTFDCEGASNRLASAGSIVDQILFDTSSPLIAIFVEFDPFFGGFAAVLASRDEGRDDDCDSRQIIRVLVGALQWEKAVA
jgi:hypothetical protein